jgi:hypothetical protein
VYSEVMLHPRSLGERAVLCWSQLGRRDAAPELSDAPMSIELDDQVSAEAYLAIAYVAVLGRGLRVDACERVLRVVDRRARTGGQLSEVQSLLSDELEVQLDEHQTLEALSLWGWAWTDAGPRRERARRKRRRRR